ncbi:MAG TPA: hypothetical protein VN645_08905 [Steroidobacteraceae bacterium]|nr:hypothetical protein [Steroidobacteraceae bacterium]
MTETPRPSRRTLLLLIALFVLPLAASFVLYYGMGWRPAGNTNHGELLQPIRQLPAFTEKLHGQWILAYAGDGACSEDCRQSLIFARQTRLSLGQDARRVGRALFATGHCCDRVYLDAEHSGIEVFDLDAAQRAELLGVLPADLAYTLFVIDPLGNIVMRYDVRESPRGLLDDMKKLLKLSSIG